MTVNYFKTECQDTTTEIKFGVCDDDDNKPAYIIASKEEKWLATIVNNSAKNISQIVQK